MKASTLTLAAIALSIALVPVARADDDHDHDLGAKHAAAYPLATCIVTGQKLDAFGEPVAHEHDGQQLLFCHKSCVEKFEKDPAAHMAKLHEAIAHDQAHHYPGECAVGGHGADAKGEAIDKVYHARLFRFCCEGCVAKFEKDPKAHTARLDEAIIAKQKEHYALKECAAKGEALGDGAVDIVIANRLVRVCSKACADHARAHPAKTLAKLHGHGHEHGDHDHGHDHGDGDHDHEKGHDHGGKKGHDHDH